MIIIPTLLSNEKRVKEILSNLEKYYIGIKDKNVFFTLLGDIKECDREEIEEDNYDDSDVDFDDMLDEE